MGTDHIAVLLSRALCDLVDYVDRRDESCTADDDVRALEDVGYTLGQVAPEDVDELSALVGSDMAEALGLSDR